MMKKFSLIILIAGGALLILGVLILSYALKREQKTDVADKMAAVREAKKTKFEQSKIEDNGDNKETENLTLE